MTGYQVIWLVHRDTGQSTTNALRRCRQQKLLTLLHSVRAVLNYISHDLVATP